MARLLLLCLALVGRTYSLQNGLPSSSCSSLTPPQGSEANFQAANGDLRYDIASACYVIFPNDTMRIRIWDRQNIGISIQGAYMQVRKTATDDISGEWSLLANTNTMKTVDCANEADSVSNRNLDAKTDQETVALWTAPATCEMNEEFQIDATVAQTQTVWHKVSVPLVCDPDYSDAEVMERVRPPLKSQYCAIGSWAIIPTRASESFEGPLRAGGWRHFYGAPMFRFRRHSGATSTAGTGPPSAQDGNYYIYYEASGTSKGDMAGLLSPFGIQGCFCFSFWCHMNTDGVTEFTLSTIGRQKRLVLRTVEVTDFWRRVLYTVTSEESVVFAFQVYSSGSDMGDVGLDNIEVTAGPCDSSIDGYVGVLDL